MLSHIVIIIIIVMKKNNLNVSCHRIHNITFYTLVYNVTVFPICFKQIDYYRTIEYLALLLSLGFGQSEDSNVLYDMVLRHRRKKKDNVMQAAHQNWNNRIIVK